MNIQQFQYVLAVVDSKNFESAAERCFVTQSTLSTMIGRLEDEIGIKIFNRKTKPVSITPEGEKIVERLRIIVNEIDSFKNVIQEMKGEMIGELKIGIIPTIAPYLLPLFLSKFADKFPGVNIVVKEMPTAEIQKELKNRTIDMGILAIPLLDKELEEQELYTEPFLIYDCSSNRTSAKIAMEELDFSKLWLLQEGHCMRTQVSQICDLSNNSPEKSFNFEFQSGSMGSLLNFTKASGGITIIPYLATNDLNEMDKQNLVQFKEPIPVRSIGLITHKFFVKKQLAKELKKVIGENIKGLIPETNNMQILNPLD
ncbi:MAG: LysR substrate-binding domain-containing protein [Flavobacteriales bacterium]